MNPIYWVHYHGNSAGLFMKLPGNDEWTWFDVEYCQDRLFDIKDSKAQEISVADLPAEITIGFDFNRTKDRIREIWKLQ